MNLVLIGYRGTGKSVLGDRLRERLRMPVCHMDERLEERFGETIPAFVRKHGWEVFREEERLLVEEVSQWDGVIIDAGGGVVTRDDNIRDLRRNGFIVWLQASPQTIAKRIAHDPHRPSLTGVKSSVDEIVEVLEARRPKYEAAADFTLQTDIDSHDECVNRILAAWRAKHETLETTGSEI